MLSRNDIARHFSFELYKRRKDLELKQTEMAERFGVGLTTYQQWERRCCIPRAEVLCHIADVLECSVDELLGRGGKDG